MGNAPDIPPEELNLTHMRTITALVGSMQRVQHEVDEIGRQFAASLFRLRSSFDLIDQLFDTAGEAAARLRDNLPKNWPSSANPTSYTMWVSGREIAVLAGRVCLRHDPPITPAGVC
jgi:hypothetical protein